MKKATSINISIFSICFCYAIIRYNIYGNIEWSQVPVYTFNKAIAFTAMFSICLSAVWKALPVSDISVRKYLGLQGFYLAVLHMILTLAILRPEYYAIMFTGNMFSLSGNITVLMGAMCIMVFGMAAFFSVTKNLEQISTWVLVGLFFLGLHILAKGIHSWPFDKWIEGLVPISLVSFCIVAATFLSKIFTTRNLKNEKRH